MSEVVVWDFLGVRVRLYAEPEYLDPREYFETAEDIEFALSGEPGDPQWFSARVEVQLGPLEGAAYLGGCSYTSFDEFIGERDGSFADLVREAFHALAEEIAIVKRMLQGY